MMGFVGNKPERHVELGFPGFSGSPQTEDSVEWIVEDFLQELPSALLAADIPLALARLQQGLAAADPEEQGKQSVQPAAEDAATPPPVALRLRAYPLIQLLSVAARRDVMSCGTKVLRWSD